MARFLQGQATVVFGAEAGDGAVEVRRKVGLGEQQIQPAYGLDTGLNLGAMRPQQLGQLPQNAQDLALLFFAQAHQFIVQVDGLERLDEQRVAAAAGAVNHAVDLALLAGHHRHDEAIVAQRDELFLQRAVVAMRAEKPLQRILDLPLLALDVAPQAMQHHAGVVSQSRIGENLAAQVAQHRPRIGNGVHVCRQSRIFPGGEVQRRADLAGFFEQPSELQDLFRLQHGAFDPQHGQRRRDIGNRIEPQPDGRAARRSLRLASRAQIRDCFGSVG